jgi:hypothetical protein
MLDQDARPEAAPLSEPTSPSRSTRGRRGAWAAAGVVVVAVAVAAGFATGRATDSTSTSAITTRGATNVAAASKTGTTLPAVNIDELGENRPDVPLDPATRAQLSADLVAARSVAMQYPTVASALAAGMIQAGKFAPQVGAHYISYPNVSREIRPDGSVDPRYPGGFIYDGNSPTSRIVGLMYISLTDNPPAGFPGPNDHWHRHSNLCIQYGRAGKIAVPFAPDRDVTRAQCKTVHGDFMQKTVWMVHAWVVPGWESPKGVFAHDDPDLRCADGTYKTDAIGFCPGT